MRPEWIIATLSGICCGLLSAVMQRMWTQLTELAGKERANAIKIAVQAEEIAELQSTLENLKK